jgi:phage regulator Rha-like protein
MLPESQECGRAQLEQLLSSYEELENNLDEVAQEQGLQDKVNQAAQQSQETAGQATEQTQGAVGQATEASPGRRTAVLRASSGKRQPRTIRRWISNNFMTYLQKEGRGC